MTNEELVQLIRAGKDPDGERMMELYKQNKGLIYKFSKRYAGRGMVEIEDLMQEGFIALDAAVKGYKEEECSFITYLYSCLRNAFLRFNDYNSTTVRLPVHRREQIRLYRQEAERYFRIYGREPSANVMAGVLGVDVDTAEEIKQLVINETAASLHSPGAYGSDGTAIELLDIIPDPRDDIGDLTDAICEGEVAGAIWDEIDKLDEKDARIIRAHYHDGKSIEEIGRIIGITKQAVSFREKQAFRRLARSRSGQVLRSYLDMYSAGLSGTGLSVFQHSGTSATERAALRMYE